MRILNSRRHMFMSSNKTGLCFSDFNSLFGINKCMFEMEMKGSTSMIKW